MDNLTHCLIGGALGAALAPAKHRRAALLAGALLNNLPDLDVVALALTDDPLKLLTWHRGATHSLLVLPLVAVALWWWLRDRVALFREAPARGFWIIAVCLLAHPLCDALTVYSTQLLWPLAGLPASRGSLFIIDPLFTLPLLVGCALALALRDPLRAKRAATVAVAVTALYVGASQAAKWQVDRIADRDLAAIGLADAPRFSVPMPFNILLWRVVAMTPDGFVEGERSLVADAGPMRFRHYVSDTAALAAVSHYPSVQRLQWFTHGFLKAERRDGKLVLSDLRMGSEPDYSFRFEVARASAAGWQPQPVEQLKWPWEATRRLPDMWRRIWNAPIASTGSHSPASSAP
jgi:inner membrane protein